MKRWLVMFMVLGLLLPVILTAYGGGDEDKTPMPTLTDTPITVLTATPSATPSLTQTNVPTASPSGRPLKQTMSPGGDLAVPWGDAGSLLTSLNIFVKFSPQKVRASSISKLNDLFKEGM